MRKGTFSKYLGDFFTFVLFMVTFIFGAQQACAGQESKAEPFPHSKATGKPSSIIFGEREVSVGNPHAPLTIVMYYSLTCPHCHEYQQDELPKIHKEFIDKGLVRFVYRDFPTDSTAIKAAKIAWCHGTNQYLAFAKRFLETQDKWVPIDLAKLKEAENAFHDIATKELGISEKDYQKCLSNQKMEDAILRQSFEAQKVYEISAAPAFLINDKYYDGIVTTETIRKHLLEMGIHG